MKILKGYFLFFSEHPIAYNLIGIALNLIYLMIVCANSPDQEHFSAPKFYHLINIVFVLNTILIYVVSNKFITRKRNDEFSAFEEHSSEWFRIIILKNGERIILDKPFWGKGKVYFVDSNGSVYDEKEGHISFKVSINGKYKNSNMSIPVSVTLKLNTICDKKEIFKALFIKCFEDNKEDNFLLLDEYLKFIFKKFNEKFQPKFDELTGRYALMEISEPFLLSNIIDVIIFPERIFSNVENVEICLGDPKFSSCKGMVECLS